MLLLLTLTLYLRQYKPVSPWQIVVIYPSREIEREHPQQFADFLSLARVKRIYLDELPNDETPSLAIAMIKLVTESESQAINSAKILIKQAQREVSDRLVQKNVIDLIETIIIYKLPQKSREEIEAKAAMEKERKIRMEFDTDSFDILIDNCCSHTLTNDIKDYIEPPVKSTVKVRGYNGSTNSAMVGTVKWKIKDDKGKIHNFILPNTYYSPSVETRLLSPQHCILSSTTFHSRSPPLNKKIELDKLK